MSSQQSSSGVDIETSFEALTNIPQILADVRAGVFGLKALISTPSAAVATGSPAASAAIVALGAEITVFLGRTAQAILDDAEGIEEVIENYRRIDGDVEAAAAAGQRQVGQIAAPPRPCTEASSSSDHRSSGHSSSWPGTGSARPPWATPPIFPDYGSPATWGSPAPYPVAAAGVPDSVISHHNRQEIA